MQQPELNNVEWMAVSVAFKDAAECGCSVPPRPGSLHHRLSVLKQALFGGTRKNALADPRLEALRRFVCATRRARRPAERHAQELADRGFSRAQIEALALLSV